MTSTCQAQNQDSIHPSSVFYGANGIKLGIWNGAMQEGEAAEAQAGAGRATRFNVLSEASEFRKRGYVWGYESCQ